LSHWEFQPTPLQASRLDPAEIEISIRERGCLSRLVPDTTTVDGGSSR